MTTTATRPESTLQARRVKEDDRVTELNRNSHRLRGFKVGPMHAVAALALAAFVMLGMFAFKPDVKHSDAGQMLETAQFWSVSGTIAIVAIVMLFMGELTTDEEVKAKRRMKRGIRKSRGTAKHLGSTIVPVLTSFHVDARINVDEALKTQIESRDGAKWNQTDSDAIALLLFEDLGREQVILSLIKDRGFTTATEIAAELEHIESTVAAPLWEGML